MSKKKHPIIHIEGCQIKSAKKLKTLCRCVTTLEEELGIHEVEISFKNIFVCPWIDLTKFSNSADPMECLIGGLLIRMDINWRGDKSQYVKAEDSEAYPYKINPQHHA